MSIPSDAQLGQDSPSGSPGISGETPGGQGRTEPLSASLTDSEADRTGRAAYAAYARMRTEQMADGRVYPAWDELDLTERFAWEAAGAAGLDDGASAVAAAERARLQPAIDRVQRLATAAQEKAVEHAVRAERKRIYAELGSDHYLIFTEDDWTTLHSVECRLSGRMSECGYHEAVRRIADDEIGPGMLGRWRITGISEGLPDLERADG